MSRIIIDINKFTTDIIFLIEFLQFSYKSKSSTWLSFADMINDVDSKEAHFASQPAA